MYRDVMEAIHGPDWKTGLPAAKRSSQLDGGQSDGSQIEAGADGVPAAETAQEKQSAAGTNRSLGAETVSEGGPSAPALRQRLMIPIDLSTETTKQFVDRIQRIAIVLDGVGDPIAEDELVEITSRGEYEATVHAFVLAPDSQATMLKDWFNEEIASDGISESERTGKCRALIELLRLRGQHVSARACQSRADV